MITYIWIHLTASKSSWTTQNTISRNKLFYWEFFFTYKVTELWDTRLLSNSERILSKPCEIKKNTFWGQPQISIKNFAHQFLFCISLIYVTLQFYELPIYWHNLLLKKIPLSWKLSGMNDTKNWTGVNWNEEERLQKQTRAHSSSFICFVYPLTNQWNRICWLFTPVTQCLFQ